MVVRRRLAGATDGMVYAVEEYPLWRDQQGRSGPQGQGQGTHHEDKSDAVSAAHEAERGCGLRRGGRVEVGAGVGRRGGGGGGRRGGGKCIDETVEEEGGPVSEMGEEGHGGRWCMYCSVVKRTTKPRRVTRRRRLQAPRDPGIAEPRVEVA